MAWYSPCHVLTSRRATLEAISPTDYHLGSFHQSHWELVTGTLSSLLPYQSCNRLASIAKC